MDGIDGWDGVSAIIAIIALGCAGLAWYGPAAIAGLIVALMLLVRWHALRHAYHCPACKQRFTLTPWQDLTGPHGAAGNGWKVLTCPHCHRHVRAQVLEA